MALIVLDKPETDLAILTRLGMNYAQAIVNIASKLEPGEIPDESGPALKRSIAVHYDIEPPKAEGE